MSGAAVAATLLAGGLGSAARYLIDQRVGRAVRGRYPAGTLAVNLVGSFVLGLIGAAVAQGRIGPEAALVLGTGMCGGLTTFSTASIEAVRLGQARRGRAFLAHTVGQLVVCCAVAALGVGLGRLLL